VSRCRRTCATPLPSPPTRPPNPPSCSAKAVCARCKCLKNQSFSDCGVEDQPESSQLPRRR
jgi:hypothetical protein